MTVLPIPTKMRQRRFGGSNHPIIEQGDCWATAVCSYAALDERARNELHRRIVMSDLALVRAGKDPQEEANWWNITIRFLAEHGLPPLGMTAIKKAEWGKLYIVSGPASRGYEHSIVAYGDGRVFNDPHPSDDGLIEVTERVCWWLVEGY